MSQEISEKVWSVLACPSCGGPLGRTAAGARCERCAAEYGPAATGQLDLRLRQPKTCTMEVTVEGPLFPEGGLDFRPLPGKPVPAVDLNGLRGPCHLPMDLRSYFPRAAAPEPGGSLVLDLGCGTQVHKEVCELAGFEYVGMDYAAPEAMLLGDGQALPFRDESFDFVLSVAVLEHIRYPLLMMREAHRVLRPGGLFLGTVAFLEPFHSNSFYHHSHLGTLNALRFGGFQIQHIAPTERFWSGIEAISNMGLFPGSPRWLSKSLIWPLRALHRLWWRAGRIVDPKATEENRMLKNSGAVIFIASKG